MSGLLVIAHLHAANKEARQTAVEALEKVSQSARQSEPDSLKYAICLPRDESDQTSIWVIEEYTNQAGFDAHMASKAVHDLRAYFGANPSLMSGPPDVTTSDVSSAFTRPDVAKATDPWICYASIEYKEGKRAEALEGWKTVTSETEKLEPGTLSYGIHENKEHAETIKTIEVYADQEYFKKVHVTSKAVQENKEKYGDEIRVSLKHAFLKLVGGHFGK